MQNSNIYYTTEKYANLTDEQIISQIKDGDEQALTFLLDKYKDLVNTKVGKYFIIGAEREDIVQEGMIGLYKAIKGFDNCKQNTFKTFANLCIERQLITAIKSSNRQKHMPLNSYLSLNTSAYDDEGDGTELLETFEVNTIEDPLETIMKQESFNEIQNAVQKSLSKFEGQVLERYMQGESYEVIAKRLDTPVKSVDNNEIKDDSHEQPKKTSKYTTVMPNEEVERRITTFLGDMFKAMNLEVKIDVKFDDPDCVNVELSGPNMGVLIGKRGQTLDSIQYLTSLVVNKGKDKYVRIKVDTEDYRNRRKETLESLAKNIAYKVKRSRKPVSLEPMNPYERRIIQHFKMISLYLQEVRVKNHSDM